jgi:predicted dehydrogenase
MSSNLNRRDFVKRSAVFGAGLWVVGSGSHLRAATANEQINLGMVGVGGRGGAHVDAAPKAGGRIVALCDVDKNTLNGAAKKQPDAKLFADFRQMLDKMGKDIDAVFVATPDHVHAPVAVAAMRLGKHVYCEKPLTHSIHEARTLTETARAQKVATQMGNQGQSLDGTRKIVEIIRSGAIGPVKEVHSWTNRPIWPQGLDEPARVDPVPDYLDWDLWLGPAHDRPFVGDKTYHPFAWRGWWDFGTGALGDMACHIVNAPYWALDLKYPKSVEVVDGEPRKAQNGPTWEIIRYEFPERGDQPPVTFTWYDGGKKPPEDLFHGAKIRGGGSLVIGEKGTLYLTDNYGASYELLEKEEKFPDFKEPEETLPRSPGHHKDFLEACKNPTGRPACSNFDYSGPLAEMVLLGVVAFRVGKKIEWDGPNMKATNCPEADQFIKTEYRKGWEL